MHVGVGAGVAAAWLMAGGCGRVGFDARGTGDGGATGDSSSDASDAPTANPGVACTGSTVDRLWSYASDAEGWSFKENSGVTATMSWTSLIGMPDAGALTIDLTSVSAASPTGWLYIQDLGDLTGRIGSAFVMTQQSNVEIKVYGRNDTSDWMDSGVVTLIPGIWSCVKLDTNNPGFVDPTFDTTRFDEHGLHIEVTAPATIYVDHWGV